MSQAPRETVAFLFSDIVGSTELLTELGTDDYGAALTTYRETVEEAGADHEGEVVDREGDGILLVFPTAADAIRAAADAQRSLTDIDWSGARAVSARMGIHLGEARRYEHGYVGLDVHRAARVGSAAHGGQILVSDTARSLVHDALDDGLDLRDLGEHRLKGLDRSERIHQLVGPGLRDAFPPPRTLESRPNNLPLQPTSFIGRERELAEVLDLVEEHRLVTLTGVGGSGKTRLAVEAAGALAPDLPDGAWLVDLAPLAEPDAVPQQVAAALSIRERTEEGALPVEERIVDHLVERRLLLLLDNCEHLIDAVAQLSERILRACPYVHLLLTSREGLGIAGERIWQVPSLDLPEGEGEVGRSDAVALFIERAAAADPSFELTDDLAPLVARICRRLDGMPLAIELAAARVRVLGVERLADRIDDRFRVLTGGSRTSLPRHQTLRATIDWSYELLDEAERTLFGRLSVFAGSFSLESAEAVCASGEIDEAHVLDLLAALVDKSLVVTVPGRTSTRYRLLETLRAYARDRLIESGEAEAVRIRHRDHYLDLADEAIQHEDRPDRLTWLRRVETDRENLRTAFDRSMAREDHEEAARLGAALTMHWNETSHFQHAVDVAREVLDHPGISDEAEAGLRRLLSRGLFNIGDPDGALAEVEAADRIARADAPSRLAARTRSDLAAIIRLHPRLESDRAVELAREAVRIARELGDRSLECRTLYQLSHCLGWAGAGHESVERTREALAIALATDDTYATLRCYSGLLRALEFEVRRPEEARQVLDEALSWYEDVGGPDRLPPPHIHHWGAYTYLRSGEWEGVDAALDQMADHHLEGTLAGWYHHLRGSVRWMRGQLEAAAEDVALCRDLDIDRWNHDVLPLHAEVAALSGRLEEVREVADEYLDTEVDPSEEEMKTAVLRPLVHAEVDAALASNGPERDDHLARAQRALDRMVDLIEHYPDPPSIQYERPSTNLALARAELSRATRPEPALWHEARDAVHFTYWELYCRWRLSESLLATGARDEGAGQLDAAHGRAVELGAELIRRELTALATRSGLPLIDPSRSGSAPR